jgi:hypothetical protein
MKDPMSLRIETPGVGLTPAGWAIGEAMADAARAKREKKVAFILSDVFG